MNNISEVHFFHQQADGQHNDVIDQGQDNFTKGPDDYDTYCQVDDALLHDKNSLNSLIIPTYFTTGALT